MMNAERFMSSELVAVSSHEVIGAAVLLWCRSWKQRPAASLPNDDRVIAAFARMPLSRFKKLRGEILRGFVLCADGRLYHKTLATEAINAFQRKLAFQRKRETEAERLRKWRKGNGDETRTDDVRNAHETRFVPEGQGQDGTVQDRTLQKEDEADASSARSSASSPVTDFLTDDPTGQPIRIIPPGGSLGDLEATHPALLVPREERAKASTVLALYGWDLCAQALTALAAEAANRPANRRRVFPDHLSAWLSARFDLGPEDYARAGITPPPKA
jgi:hypothetical protein